MSNKSHWFEMVKDDRIKYIKALRSGEYEQTTGAHFKHGCYCALGVAMEITTPPDEDLDNRLCDAGQLFGSKDKITELIDMNDMYRLSFNQIADSLVSRGFLDDFDYPLHDHDMSSSLCTSAFNQP